ncbi:hypothetical protein ISS30_07145 [bacterium]|nr:hypothetical protein [FCB group bacterium]MBL7191455.1 hypothetical protein [bacterium]
MQTFSQRYGYKPVREQLQFESMDEDLRNSLWNSILGYILEYDDEDVRFTWNFIKLIWIHFYKEPLDDIPKYLEVARNFIKDKFYKYYWNEVFDFIEYIINQHYELDKCRTISFIMNLNYILKRECSAYTVIKTEDKYYISPITNEEEIAAIESAIEGSFKLGVKNVGIHLQSALDKLSDKKEPDYRNSIKESISAVEALCNKITDKQTASLGDCLKKIDDSIINHTALKEAFIKIYGWTSNAEGIRHALMGESNLDLEDARFMLVSCSAFINYLIVKAGKAGIKFS